MNKKMCVIMYVVMLFAFIGVSVELNSAAESDIAPATELGIEVKAGATVEPEIVQDRELDTKVVVEPEKVKSEKIEPDKVESKEEANIKAEVTPETDTDSTSDIDADRVPDTDSDGLEIIDTIKLVVMNTEDIEITTLSDLDRPNVTGVRETLQDKLDAALVFLETKLRKIMVTDEEIDRDFVIIQKNNKMTRDDLENLFIEMGSTWEKMKEVFRKMKANKMLIDHMIRSQLVVPRKMVIAYYEQNPDWVEVSYTLKRAFVASNTVKNNEIEIDSLVWSLPFTVLDSDLAEDKYMIKNLSLEEISAPIKIDDGFELFCLVGKQERRLKTLEERYAEIADILRKPRYIELVNEFMQELKAKSYIQYL